MFFYGCFFLHIAQYKAERAFIIKQKQQQDGYLWHRAAQECSGVSSPVHDCLIRDLVSLHAVIQHCAIAVHQPAG